MTWVPGPLKYWLDLNDSGLWGEDPLEADGTPVVRSTDIKLDGSWDLQDVALRRVPIRERMSKKLRNGDLVVVKSSGSAEHLGKTAIVDQEVEDLGACFANFVQRLRPSSEADPKFVWYVMNSQRAAAELEILGNTTTGLRNLNGSIVGAVTFPGPPLKEQRAIADFLDAQTARIDALVTKKRRLIDLLNQRRWRFFLTQIDSTGANRSPLRRTIHAVTDGPFGSAFTSSEYADDGIAVIRLGNIGFAEFRGDELVYLSEDRFLEFRRHQVMEGNLLIAGLGDERNHAGRACVAPNLGKAIVKGKCFCAQLDLARVNPDFIALFLSSPLGAELAAVQARGSTRSMINLEILKSVELPLPPLLDQQSIAARTRNHWRTSEGLNQRLERQIALLQERRQALITAAVTGQIEVPGAAA